MKTLIYGAGPIGRWLALKLERAGKDVTLLARNETYLSLVRDGIRIVDGLTGRRFHASVKLVRELSPQDRYDLVVAPMAKSSRLAVCPILAKNDQLENILFLGNEVAGPAEYLKHLSKKQVLLGFPGAGGGWDGDDLVIVGHDKPGGKIFIGELDGKTRARTRQIKELFEAAGIKTSVEKNIDGWLKYHFAFMGPTAGVIFKCGGSTRAVAADKEAIHQYCRACREAGDVLRAVGYPKRQPGIFNLYYWTPRRLEPKIFSWFFAAHGVEVAFGLHAATVGPELLLLAEEFADLKARAGMETPSLDALLACVQKPALTEVTS